MDAADDDAGGITAPDVVVVTDTAGGEDAGPLEAPGAAAASLENGSFGVTSKTYRFEGGLAPTGSAFEKTSSPGYQFEIKTDLESQE